MDQSDLKAPTWQLSERARKLTSSAIREILKVTERPEVISFAGGLPSPATFPAERMREASDRILRDSPPGPLHGETNAQAAGPDPARFPARRTAVQRNRRLPAVARVDRCTLFGQR